MIQIETIMKKICSSCIACITLFAIFFIISISISSVFIYFYWHLHWKYIETAIYWMQFCWTYKWEILTILILRIVHMIKIKDFDSSLMKIDKKSYKKLVL